MNSIFGLQAEAGWWLFGTGVLTVLALSLTLILLFRVSRLRKKYIRAMGQQSVANLEQVLLQIRDELEQLNNEKKRQQHELELLQTRVSKLKGNIGFHRYHAFEQSGSDLSFSLALLDANNNGVVMSGLHNRDVNYIYAKPVEKGASTYTLTPEEHKAIDLSRLQKNNTPPST